MLIERAAAAKEVPAPGGIASEAEVSKLEDGRAGMDAEVREAPGMLDGSRDSSMELAKRNELVKDGDVLETGTDELAAWSEVRLDDSKDASGATVSEAERTLPCEREAWLTGSTTEEDIAPKDQDGAIHSEVRTLELL